jgi:hypothetical protein
VNKDRILDDIDNWAFDKMRELAKDLMMRYLIVEHRDATRVLSVMLGWVAMQLACVNITPEQAGALMTNAVHQARKDRANRTSRARAARATSSSSKREKSQV